MLLHAPLRVYTVHESTRPGRGSDHTVFVPDGFAWGAAVFSALWAVLHRMWFAALIMAAVLLAIGFAFEHVAIDPGIRALVGLVVALYIGLEAREWQRAALSRRGYREAGVVVASSALEAEQRWFERHPVSIPGILA